MILYIPRATFGCIFYLSHSALFYAVVSRSRGFAVGKGASQGAISDPDFDGGRGQASRGERRSVLVLDGLPRDSAEGEMDGAVRGVCNCYGLIQRLVRQMYPCII